MGRDLAELTDKEKEALRLLLAGHDAKSCASELGLSVHTVNDRLRNARRKLGVSSSREAARILGDAEGEAPQNLAPASFGIGADMPADDTADLTDKRHPGATRLIWLAGGMLVMSILIAAAIISLTTSGEEASPTANTAGLEATQSASFDAEDSAALAAAEPFMARLDARDWSGSWDLAGPMVKSAVNSSEWANTVGPVRAPLGEVEQRRIATVQRVASLPNAPDGEYAVLTFQTVFAEREGIVTETVILSMGQDGWEVAGYFIT